MAHPRSTWPPEAPVNHRICRSEEAALPAPWIPCRVVSLQVSCGAARGAERGYEISVVLLIPCRSPVVPLPSVPAQFHCAAAHSPAAQTGNPSENPPFNRCGDLVSWSASCRACAHIRAFTEGGWVGATTRRAQLVFGTHPLAIDAGTIAPTRPKMPISCIEI